MKKEKASKLVKKVEKIYTGEEVQKEFDERKKQKECTCPDCSSKLKIKKYKGKDRYECSQCGFTAFVEGWV
jgi:transposase-like protein